MTSERAPVRAGLPVDATWVTRLEHSRLRVEAAPEIGGRLTRLTNTALGREFLWRNPRLRLERAPPGAAFDPRFYGGVDEVLPGDLPEAIYGLECPDHGELWTLPLEARIEGEALELSGRLPRWGLHYRKTLRLRPAADWLDLDYVIENQSGGRRAFLWKLHAALAVSAGDEIVIPAAMAAVAEPRWSRWGAAAPFTWPYVGGQRADRVPPPDGSTDFLFLYDLRAGQAALRRPSLGCELRLEFDERIFPYVCVFASYGGLDGHYTVVLEPCTAMPLSVVEADRLGQCSALEAGARLNTRVSIYAGPLS